MARIAIIGAGISGLVCASNIQAKHDVTVFEKSASVSGRMLSKQNSHLSFDHGAQYFTARDSKTLALLHDWVQANVSARWTGKIVVLEDQQAVLPDTEITRFVGTPSMDSLAQHLAEPLIVHLNTQITKTLKKNQQWHLEDEAGITHGPFDYLICATVPEQVSKLLSLEVEHPFTQITAESKMNPCWATLVHFEKRLPLDYDAAFVNGCPLRWIARNNSKPGRDQAAECWVLHAEQAWSVEHLESSPEEVTLSLLETFFEATQVSPQTPAFATSHLWRYSIPDAPLEKGCLFDESMQLGICGDWCHGARVEGAILSGLSIAEKILNVA
ncbi:MAG: NAD(P)/FAD-dependent oxidoreductase [Pirellulales bacterium]